MKTNEFIKEAEAMGFKCTFCNHNYRLLHVYNINDGNMVVAIIDVTEMFSMNTTFNAFWKLEKGKREQLFNLLTEYASTPVLLRGNGTEFKYKLKHIPGVFSDNCYLVYVKSWEKFTSSQAVCRGDVIDTFTHEELKYYGADLDEILKYYDEIEIKEKDLK